MVDNHMQKYYVLDLPENKQYIGLEDCHLISGNFKIAVPVELYEANNCTIAAETNTSRMMHRNEFVDYKL